MPKVSDEYREARRAEILDAARRCFARDGFHQTSMQDLFAEAGVSAGAVYRYFPSKADMIVAIAQANMGDFVRLLQESTSAGADGRSLGAIVADMLETVRDRQRDACVGGIALTVWAEGVRDRQIADALKTALVDVRAELAALADLHIAAGRLPAGLSGEAVAATLMTLVPGYIMQVTLYGEDAVAGVPDALRALWPDTA